MVAPRAPAAPAREEPGAAAGSSSTDRPTDEDLIEKLRPAICGKGDPGLFAPSALRPIRALLEAGCDLDRDVVPEIRKRAQFLKRPLEVWAGWLCEKIEARHRERVRHPNPLPAAAPRPPAEPRAGPEVPAEAAAAWGGAWERLRGSLGPDVMASWFGGLTLEAVDARTATFAAPSRMVRGAIETRYAAKIEAALAAEGLGPRVAIRDRGPAPLHLAGGTTGPPGERAVA